MKSLRLISSLNLISLGLMLLSLPACETKEETVKTTSVKPLTNNKIHQKPMLEKPVNIPVIKSDSNTIVPDTIETHDTQQQKKSVGRIVRKVLNFHKKPLIT